MKINRDFLCWVTGFYEGEGSCGFYKYPKMNGRLQLTIAQKEAQYLLLIKEKFGFGTIHYDKNGCHTFYLSGEKVLDFIYMISPYMKVDKKKDQLARAIIGYLNREPTPRVKSPLKSAIAKARRRKSGGFIANPKLTKEALDK